ncbi:hypothetical protein RJ639_016323 [Escallonia herrerae]|uniref:Glycosyltransferases n=1 Tax=Escallonia herrerae TaxID=1293975 RepID=A0AA88VFL0_9ASTE|nr:hypothetical protein RJ639_016323 [Escallonia herrerae]
MASIRRTLSPVPRPGILLNGEVCSIASPLSKSSSCNQHYQPSGASLFSSLGSLDYALYRVQAFIQGLFSQRSSRALERTKLKGQFWRRALFHFSVCFVVGIFVGLTPYVSLSLSMNLMSKHQTFSFEVHPPDGEVHVHDIVPRNVTPLAEGSLINDTALLEPHATDGELGSVVSDDSVVTQVPYQDSVVVIHKLLIIVTPTYSRPFQAYYLNRLGHTLKLIPPPLLWIVVEMTSQSAETAAILRRTGVMYRHLVCGTNLTQVKDRRVHQRNVALSHIETHRLDGILHFADDANIYTDELFEQMRQIRRFGTWTVAKLMQGKAEAMLEGPICNGTRVIGWHTKDMARRFRRFHAEMSGFAFNSTILWDRKRWHRPTLESVRQLDNVKEGFQVSFLYAIVVLNSLVSTFIEQVLEDESQMEGLPPDCSKVMVLHSHVESWYSYPREWFS